MLRLIASLACNLFIMVSETVVFYRFLKKEGAHELIFYTTDSNLFAGAVSAVYVVLAFKALAEGGIQVSGTIPQMLRYMAATGLSVTFLVVVFVLSRAPECGGLRHLLLDDSMLFSHLLCPVVSMVSFLFLESTSGLGKNAVAVCLIPTGCYAVLSVTLNLLKRWNGPYPFLKVYENGWKKSICYVIGLLVFITAIATGLLVLNRLFVR